MTVVGKNRMKHEMHSAWGAEYADGMGYGERFREQGELPPWGLRQIPAASEIWAFKHDYVQLYACFNAPGNSERTCLNEIIIAFWPCDIWSIICLASYGGKFFGGVKVCGDYAFTLLTVEVVTHFNQQSNYYYCDDIYHSYPCYVYWWQSWGTVCLSVFLHDISKTMQLGSPNVTYKCSTVRPGNPLILGSRGQHSRSRVTKNSAGVGICTLVSAGFF